MRLSPLLCPSVWPPLAPYGFLSVCQPVRRLRGAHSRAHLLCALGPISPDPKGFAFSSSEWARALPFARKQQQQQQRQHQWWRPIRPKPFPLLQFASSVIGRSHSWKSAHSQRADGATGLALSAVITIMRQLRSESIQPFEWRLRPSPCRCNISKIYPLECKPMTTLPSALAIEPWTTHISAEACISILATGCAFRASGRLRFRLLANK